MAIYALGDLHLSFNENKPMDIFGDNWKDYEKKIEKNWKEKIKEEDLVILPGDFSWAMHLEDAIKDFEFIDALPGKKVLIKGNHDYWWTTLKSMKKFIKENKFKNIEFLFNDSIIYENNIIVGTRGWAFNDTENSERMLARELNRLELSIQDAIKKNEKEKENREIICAMHYPPITKTMIRNGEKSPYLELLQKYNIHTCIYGHLHGKAHNEAVEEKIQGVQLNLVSSDYLNFIPKQLTKN